MSATETKRRKVPVTILTGFLGAGKTTFLTYLMTEKHGKRIAVIQNEFGRKTGIEEAMVIGQDGKSQNEWLELPNGCICCSVRDDFVMTVEKLMEKKRDLFDYILIETTGLADPGQVAGVFWLDDELESALYLDSVITIVDAKHIGRQLQYGLSAEERALASAEGELSSEEQQSAHSDDSASDARSSRVPLNEAQRQIAFADRLIINKTDLVDADELQQIARLVRAINPDVDPLSASYGRVDLDLLLDIHAFDARGHPSLRLPTSAASCTATTTDAAAAAATATPVTSPANRSECAGCSGAGETHTHAHTLSDQEGALAPLPTHLQSVAAHSVVHCGEVTEEQVNLWLADLLWEQGREEDVYRFKGQVAVAGQSQKYVLQGVHSLFELAPSGVPWGKDEVRACSFVFIGRALDSTLLNESFRRYCATKSE
mmetsp:Transcript_25156/g.63271  ORF Transcript_25156/g.63271 Transcript_25156/m.63271 type:complete len:430 (-) Transcript_25156:7-1296(-)|eukprot:CAMPEP_0174239462 /NCGR_PEP_ID=MMETSP0417-20130205/14819_1 /TAXON_ID=242541 /ORGANISM="Mayorella sp, Strain BSH-02190019" /LENGTH=429 /DNA_ID=CAMNT_0015318405 /DNA_START=46 /DNA_END=1335 /DNA_ORIENTATION=-